MQVSYLVHLNGEGVYYLSFFRHQQQFERPRFGRLGESDLERKSPSFRYKSGCDDVFSFFCSTIDAHPVRCKQDSAQIVPKGRLQAKEVVGRYSRGNDCPNETCHPRFFSRQKGFFVRERVNREAMTAVCLTVSTKRQPQGRF